MSAKHTLGRLTVTHNSWETSTIYCDGKEVARVHINSESHEDDEQHCENARRLAACWNACEGIPTEVLERQACISKASYTMRMHAEAQRDELLRALKELLGPYVDKPSEITGMLDLLFCGEDISAARAAIAKAIG